MRILFAGIIARYPFGGVTWCSLMYLLGLRALGHEVFYIEDTGECVYDPVQNTRATDPTYGTTYIHDALEPFGLGDRWSFVNYDGSYHGRSADEVRRYCAGRRSVHQPVRRIVVLARRVRAHPAQGRSSTPIRRSRSSRSPRPSRGTSSSSSASITCSRSARTSARRRRRFRPAPSPGTRPGSRSRSTTGAPTRAPRRPLHHGDDLADRELHRRRRQQGSGVRQVHRSAVADAAAASSSRSTARSSCCASTAGTRSTRWACRARSWDYRDFIQRSKAEFGVAKHTYVATPIRLVQRSHRVLPRRRAARRWCRTPAGPRTCRPATACSRSRRRTKRSPASTASTATTTATRGARVEIAREHFDARVVLPRLLERRAHERADESRTSRRSRRRFRRPSPGSVETMTSLLTEGLVARGHDVTLFATADSTTTREAARHLSARLLARRAHVAVGAVRDAEPRGGRRARGRVRHHPLRSGVLPDVAGVHAAVADADRPDAAPLAERRRGRAVVALSRGAVRRHLATSRRACWPALNVVGTVLHGIDTDSFTFRETPDDYLLFLGRFTEGKGVLQAIEIAKRVGMRLILAAAEDDYYREHVAPHVDGTPHRLLRRGRLRGQGEAVRRRARAALPDSGARAVRAGARRSDGLRHAGRRARPRRGARGRRRRRHRHGLRRPRADGQRAAARASISIAAASASARSRASASQRMVDEYIAVYRRIVEAHRGRRADDAAPGRPHRARHLRPSRRRVAGLRRHAGAARRRRRPRRPAVRVARRSADRSAIRRWCRTAISARVRVARAARGGRGARRRRGDRARSSRRRPALGRTCPSCTPRSSRRSERYRPDAVITFAEDGLYWHLDHIGVHERTYTAVQSLGADAPPLYYVTMPHGVMREVVEAAHAKGGAPPDSSFWGIAPDAFGDGAEPADASSSTSRDWVPRKLAALRCHRTQMGAEQPDRLDRRGRGAALARRRAVPPRAARRGRRSDARAARRTDRAHAD